MPTPVRLDLKKPEHALRAYQEAVRLEGAGRHEEARKIYRALAKLGKAPMTFHRIVAEGLLRTGEAEMADKLIANTIRARAKLLPDTLEEALERAWDTLDTQKVDPRALGWAWEHRDPALEIDRDEFERRAKWGMAADMVLLDWLECRPDDKSAKTVWRNGEERAAVIRATVESGEGFGIVGAHLGSVFAGPLFYQLWDLDVHYVGAFSRIPSSPMSARILPIPELSKDELRSEADAVVARGHVLAVSPDGSLEGPLIDLGKEGLPDVRVGPMIARVVHRHRSGNAFRHVSWKDGGLFHHSTPMPRAEEGEPFDDFFARWLDAYTICIRETLATIQPEDLRLNAGLWRGIKRL